MLPVSRMSRATGTCAGSLSVLIIASVMRMLAWWGMNASRSSASTPAASSACWRDRRHLPHGPAEDLLALHASACGKSTLVVADVDPGRALGDGVVLRAVGAPDRRADGRLVGRADHDRAGAVAEDERRRPVVGVGEVRELLAADDQRRTRRCRRAPCRWPARRRSRSRRRRRRCRCAAASVAPSRCGDRRRGRRGLQRVGDGREMTAPTCSGRMPAWAIALPAAATLMSMTVSSGAAQRRVSMPERSRIHSSEESMRSQISSLVTTRDGR